MTPEQLKREYAVKTGKIKRSPDPLGEVLTLTGLRYDM